MKTLLLFSLSLCLQASTFARENAYDLLGRCLTPFVNLVVEHSKNPNRALLLSARLEQMTGLSEDFAGAHADLALEYPDKLRLHGPVQGEELTICRNGQEIWVSPGSRAAALMQKLQAEKRMPLPDPKFVLGPFRVPIPEKQLVFLPALFSVHEAESEMVDGVPCHVLDIQLNPALAHSLKAQEWSGRLWLNEEAQPVRLALRQGAAWSATIRFDTVKIQPTLPLEVWKPSPEQASDVAKISPVRYNQILRAVVGGK